MIIRPQTEDDIGAIHRLHRAAFETKAEADLVDRLRADGDAVFSLIARSGAEIAGHAMFSRMRAPFPALGLAPVSVSKDFRRQGIAAALIEDGLARAAEAGWQGIFVLGDPAYYTRFGFSAGTASGFQSPYAGPYLMARPLGARVLPETRGRVEYAPAFAALG